MSKVRMAWGNSCRICCSRQRSPSRTIWIVLVVSGAKPRRVACRRAQSPALNRGGSRRPTQEHAAEFGGQTEADTGAEPTEPTDELGAEAVACQPELGIQGMETRTVAPTWDQVDAPITQLPPARAEV